MKTLNPNWFAEGLIDCEYKKYVLLSYLQEVEKEFKSSKIFPALQNIKENVKFMTLFKDKCEELSSKFPKELNGIDPSTGQLKYTANVNDPELLQTIYEIIDYSMPHLQEKLAHGHEIFDCVQDMIEIEPLGILPLYKDEGYLMVNCKTAETDIYSYQLSLIQDKENSRLLKTKFIRRVKTSISNTFYSIKEKLVSDFNELPNPATFLILSELDFPKESTLMPVAKRMFLRSMAINSL